jgi:alpha-D-ribose 1-methylphosphonate 5-triphosphate synthase subunit PhnG
MAVLAKSSPEDLEKAREKLESPPSFRYLKKPEVGLVMIRARAGGTGPRFNLGEMSVTRCTVQVEDGAIGCAYVAGRGPGHAETAALFDALLQDSLQHTFVMEEIIRPLEAILNEKREREAGKVASTRVEFFTMVRGE